MKPRLLVLGLAALVSTTQASGQASSQGQSRAALKAQIRAAGFRVLIGLRADSLSHGMLPNGRSALNDNAAEAITRNLERKGLRRLGRVTMVPVAYGTVAEADLDGIMNDPNVEYVEPDEFSALTTYSGPTVRFAESTPWGIPRVTAPDAWALGGSTAYGAGVKVGYLDSGGDWNHPDLLFAGGYSIVKGSAAPADWLDSIASCKGHGTHIAGTIAGQHNTVGVVGVAPEASLYAIQVFQDVGGVCGSYTSSEIAGIDWASKNGIRVVSISIGGTSFSSSYQSAITSAVTKGMYVVAAAGNNSSTTLTYPGGYQDVLSVGALTSSNTKSSYSNYGPKLYIAAPGDNIYSTLPGGAYGNKSGTSMATPHVAGVVTLLLARYPGISRAQLLARLEQGALDLGVAGRDDNTGWGLVRAREAMDAAVSQPLVLSVAPASRRDTVANGATSADADWSSVSLTGDNNATTAWSASAKHSWTQLTSASGTGSGTVSWNRNPSGLAAGVHVDTITVVASSQTVRVIDSLVVLPPPTPLALSVSPASRRDSAEVGALVAHSDSGSVSLSGTGASTTAWTATQNSSWLVLTTASGTGSGKVRWTRNPTGLLAGIYVDTISVSAAGVSSQRIIDSLRLYVDTSPLTEVVAPHNRYHSAKQSTNSLTDSASVVLTGAGSSFAAWTATSLKPWTTLSVAAGVGSGKVRWSHNLTGLATGTYVDTITVVTPNAIGSPSRVIDTLVITQKGKRVGRTTSVGSSINDGAVPRLDSVYVDVAAGTSWDASTNADWLTLVTASGDGPGYLRWQHDLAVVSYGISEDSIVVMSGSGGNREVELVVAETLVSGADQIPALTVASALFGAAELTALQQQMLDFLGNANGRYDVGDLLAYLDRTGYVLSAPMMARVMALPPH